MADTFNTDLDLSQGKERELEDKLQQLGYQTTNTKHLGCFPGYDVTAYYPDTDKITRIELKYQIATAETGNVAVELYKVRDAYRVDTGLNATTAEWWCFAFTDLPGFYLIPTSTLKDMVNKRLYSTIRGTRETKHFNALFERDLILPKCHKL